MCGGVGGSTAASCLIAALAAGAGQFGGGRDVYLAMQAWAECGTDLAAWQQRLATPAAGIASIWPQPEHLPGFDPHGVTTATVVRQTLAVLAASNAADRLRWLVAEREALEVAAGRPLALAGIAAAAFADLGFSPEAGEMLHLMLRLPGAAAHALEQRAYGYKNFPFYAADLVPAVPAGDAAAGNGGPEENSR